MSIDKLLLFAAHHDDEVISCAGTIKKLTDQGINVVVVFATDGSTGVDHTNNFKENIVETRINESQKVAKFLGISKTINWNIECQKFENSAANLHRAIKVIREEKPCLIITHDKNEKHRDHINLSNVVREASWKASEDVMPDLGAPYRVPDLWSFEVVDQLDRVDFCVDITEYIQIKLEAMRMYSSQENVVSGIEKYIEGVSLARGYLIGVDHAEAFKKNSFMPTEVFL